MKKCRTGRFCVFIPQKILVHSVYKNTGIHGINSCVSSKYFVSFITYNHPIIFKSYLVDCPMKRHIWRSTVLSIVILSVIILLSCTSNQITEIETIQYLEVGAADGNREPLRTVLRDEIAVRHMLEFRSNLQGYFAKW